MSGCNGLGEIVFFEPELLVDLDKKVPDCFLAFNDEGRLPFAHFDRDVFETGRKTAWGFRRWQLRDWSTYCWTNFYGGVLT